MRLPNFMLNWLAVWAWGKMAQRAPDFVIGDNYLRRWWVIPRNRFFNIYLHEFGRSDDDRALHDHPWLNCSIILHGNYVEHSIRAGGVHVRVGRRAGDIVCRLPSTAHRVEMAQGGGRPITLFITGPRMRQWGFHCPESGWKHWAEFTAPGDPGSIGPGCGA